MTVLLVLPRLVLAVVVVVLYVGFGIINYIAVLAAALAYAVVRPSKGAQAMRDYGRLVRTAWAKLGWILLRIMGRRPPPFEVWQKAQSRARI